jgi:eukaryotic-like serine/threonine-protein kinase
VWFDRSGRELGPAGPPGYANPAISPDGRFVAATFDSTGSGDHTLWVHELQRGISTRLTHQGPQTAAAWSADGRWLAYSTQQREKNGLARRAADGSGEEERLIESEANLLLNDLSRDGRLLYMDFADGEPRLTELDLATRRTQALGIGAEASYSPDGAWITYLGFPVGTLFVMPATPGAGRVQLAPGAAAQARWRRDGREIFYIAPDKKMMAVPVTVRDGVFQPGTPVPLFQTRIVRQRLVLFQYDVTADGRRFLINSLPREDAAAPLTLLVNWNSELRR